MTKEFAARIGPRDIDLLTALDRCPLTPAQLCRLSVTFTSPFADEGNLRRRLRELASAGLLQKFPYAVCRDGRTPDYWKLTPSGYRILYGTDAAMPKRRYFQRISPGHHHHSFSLAETIVHLCVCAQCNGCQIVHFARENAVELKTDTFVVYPDCVFVIRRADGRTFPFVIELDNGTERVRSKQDTESIERKLRGYDLPQAKYDAHDPNRYLVLFITTRSELRLQHILQAAGEIMVQPQRRVFFGVDLKTFTSPRAQAIACPACERAVRSVEHSTVDRFPAWLLLRIVGWFRLPGFGVVHRC